MVAKIRNDAGHIVRIARIGFLVYIQEAQDAGDSIRQGDKVRVLVATMSTGSTGSGV